MQRTEKLYEVQGSPVGEPTNEGTKLATATQLSEAAKIDRRLMRRRLSDNGWRKWELLSLSPEQAKARQQNANRKRMRAERLTTMGEKLKAQAIAEKIQAGHKEL